MWFRFSTSTSHGCMGLGTRSAWSSNVLLTLDMAGGKMRRSAERTVPLSLAGGPCPRRALPARPNVAATGPPWGCELVIGICLS